MEDSLINLRKQVRYLKYIIVILIFIILCFITINFILPQFVKLENRANPKGLLPYPKEKANDHIGDYRRSFAYQRLSFSMAPKVQGITHEMKHMGDYITFFNKFQSTHLIMPNCEWRIGFYPGVYEESGKPRLGIYVIPTMYDTGTGKPVDYFDIVEKSALYKMYYLTRSDGSSETDEFVYDQGTIFP